MKKLYSIIAGLFCFATLTAAAASVTLAWDKSCDPSVSGYIVYYNTNYTTLSTNVVAAYTDDCGNFHPQATNIYHTPFTSQIPAGTNCTATVSNVINGFTYSFVVTATNLSGLESDYSNEVRYTVPNRPQPPAVLKFP
jgi:hypothetical protein